MFQEPNRTQTTRGNSTGGRHGAAGGAPGDDRPAAWDAELARAVRQVAVLRTGFYVVVLLVALGGQVSGAMERLGMPWYVALPAVGALELGGVVVLANADVRRRLGEGAVLSRVLSAGIAAGAVVFNWLAHANHLEGGFYAGMSLLGYLVWLMNTENQRRDRLRAKQQLPPTTPAYEPVGHWLRHPWLTRRARSLAKADPGLGLYDSLDAAHAQIRAERRQAALSKVLHRKIRRALDATTADIALAVYDLDEIARRLGERADYDGLTALIAADLAPERVLAGNLPAGGRRRWWRRAGQPDPVALASAARLLADTPAGVVDASEQHTVARAPEAALPPGAVPISPSADAAPGGSAASGSAGDDGNHGKATDPAAQSAERPPSERSEAEAPDRTDLQMKRTDGDALTSTTDQPDPSRASDWAALHAELAPLLPATAPRRTPRNAVGRSAASRGEASATTAAPGFVAEPAAPAPSATTRSPAPTTRTATGRARTTRVTDSTAEPGPVAQVTRELPLVGGRDLPDLVDTAASRTTPPAAVPDTAERTAGQRSASRRQQHRRDGTDPRPGSDTVRRRADTESAETGRR
ncbi:hypothetical protein ACGFIY_17335 [Micromonospora chersina]|uniref:hypothetical protein n=1 Tax=Micromonospora chersina TaxID=47854 RepID=UPI00371D9352